MVNRRIDPDPITIYMAIVATCAAAVGTVNLMKSHYKPLPTKVRAKLKVSLTTLGDHAKQLRADLSIIEEIFRDARFPIERTIRFGSGAYVTVYEFARYEKVSKGVFRRLGEVHKLSLKMERDAMKLSELKMGQTTNVLGEVYENLDRLMESRNLSPEEAWHSLRTIAEGLEKAIVDLTKQLSGP